MDDDTMYDLIQSNNITYNQSIQISSIYSCQRVNLLTADQFIAPAGSVVGLYSNDRVQLLYTNTDESVITTYQFVGNQSSVSAGNDNDVNYNIAIKVHIGMYSESKEMTLKYCVHTYCTCMHFMYNVCLCLCVGACVHVCYVNYVCVHIILCVS